MRHDLQISNAMVARAQIALYRLQRQAEALEHARQRRNDARLRLAQAESDTSKKAVQIQSAKDATNHSDAPDARTEIQPSWHLATIMVMSSCCSCGLNLRTSSTIADNIGCGASARFLRTASISRSSPKSSPF